MNALKRLWRHPASRWALLGTSVLLLVLDAYDVTIFPRGAVDPVVVGAVGDWVVGSATAGAVAVAGYGLRVDRRRTEDAKRTRDEASASEVYVWLERPHLRPGNRSDAVLVTVNRTSVPIYRWKLTIEGFPRVGVHEGAFGPILPGERHLNLGPEIAAALDESGSERTRVAITFQTSLGSQVTRSFEGSISKDPE